MKNLFSLSILLWAVTTLSLAQHPSIGGYNVYYGHLHNHTTVSDGSGSPDRAYSTARSNGLDFFGTADHAESTSSSEYTTIKNTANNYNQDGVFTTFYGFEWSSGTYGHIAVINSPDHCSSRSSSTNTFDELRSWMSSRECIAFFNHPGREDDSGREFDHFTDTPDDKFVGIELWNKTSGFSRYYYNDGYYRNDGQMGYWEEALARGWKLGASGAEDNHGTNWGAWVDYRMAILSNNLTRTDLYEAMKARRFFSTEDENIALSFKISDQEMGSTVTGGSLNMIVRATDGNRETYNKIMLFKNGVEFQTWNINTSNINHTYTLSASDGDFYYVKITQADGDEAISSPIWIEGGSSNNAPECSLTTPTNGTHYDNPQNITITATASDSDGSISQVEFFVNDNSVGTDTSSPYSINYNISANGSYSIYAVATDNLEAKTNSSTVNITVGDTPTEELLTYDDFESGWGNWVDGGSDCYRYTGGTYAHQGNDALGLQDNSGTRSSSWLANSLDVTSYNELKVEFWYMPVSMDNSNEDFWLQYYNGSSWITIETWARGTDFENNNFYFESVIIKSSDYNFPSNASFRFRCDASSNSDDVYIDEIAISGITSTLKAASFEEVMLNQVDDQKSNSIKFNIYPNPANGDYATINIEQARENMTVRVFDIHGIHYLTIPVESNKIEIPIYQLNSGIYLVVLSNGNQQQVEKLIIK